GADAAAAVLARGARQPGRVRGSRRAGAGLYDAVGLTRPGRFGADASPWQPVSHREAIAPAEPIPPQRADLLRLRGRVPGVSDSHPRGSCRERLCHVYGVYMRLAADPATESWLIGLTGA